MKVQHESANFETAGRFLVINTLYVNERKIESYFWGVKYNDERDGISKHVFLEGGGACMKFESKVFLWILVHLCLIIGGDNCVFKTRTAYM